MTDDFDITTVRKLTALRNKPGLAKHLKQRLTNLLNTAEEINKETADEKRRDLLIQSFVKQWAKYVIERNKAGDAVAR